MSRLNELKVHIFDMLELLDSEEDMEKVLVNVASALIEINPMCKSSDALMYRRKILSIITEIKETCILEYFYYFMAGKLGKLSPEEVFADVCE